MSNDVLLECSKGVATVILNRPQHLNVISYSMWLELKELFERLEEERDVRVVVIRGAGEAFSAGSDIKDFLSSRNNSAQARAYSDALTGAMDALGALTKPSISMIRGFCLGGGLGLALFTDLRIAADDSRFSIPAARLSILYDYKKMQRLVGLIGPGNAMYLLLTARPVGAEEALRMGLVNQVVPVSQLEEYTYGLAEEIVQNAPLSHRGHKRILKAVLDWLSPKGLTQEELELPLLIYDSEDYQEGVRAFLERRRPRFRGK